MNSLKIASRIEVWPIDRLIPYARNPRTHSPEQIQQLVGSIRENGFVNPVWVDRHGNVIAGHGRILAAQYMGLTHLPAIVLDHLTDTQAQALRIADNRITENGGWDEAILQAELAALLVEKVDLTSLGFAELELKHILEELESQGEAIDEDAAPEISETPVTRTGDLWGLGQHRLLVGDATVASDVHRLMAGEVADLVFTDLPYNVGYQGYTEDQLTIEGDCMSREQFERFLHALFASYRSIVKPSASLYVCHSSSWQREFQNAIEQAGFAVRCQLIWAKNTFAWGFGRYKFQHEPIFYCHVKGQKDAWFGDKSQSTLWEENKPAANRLHPCMKPVSLIEHALANSSTRGDIVVDFFGGAGSTLIGCERQGRKARLMEIDPKYADCIIGRWQQYTGQQAVLEGDGRRYDEVAKQRRLATA